MNLRHLPRSLVALGSLALVLSACSGPRPPYPNIAESVRVLEVKTQWVKGYPGPNLRVWPVVRNEGTRPIRIVYGTVDFMLNGEVIFQDNAILYPLDKYIDKPLEPNAIADDHPTRGKLYDLERAKEGDPVEVVFTVTEAYEGDVGRGGVPD